ncbi:alpha/beta hydrolase [Actinomycetales bacterium SN12]|nr:alpha/beta hydrolase [Actinomycetales bacterium SN12]
MSGVLRRAVWWAEDYAYAAVWQARAFASRVHPESFLSGTGTPIVVLPGIYETWKFMQPLALRVHELGHPVHVLDSLHRNLQPVAEMADGVAAYLAAHSLQDVVLLAHSKGGLAGKLAMLGFERERIRGMVAVATPFGGSRYARLMLPRNLRALSPRDPSIVHLSAQHEVNARIVSVYARFDPHIPEGSELPGAKNVPLDTGGHFRVLANPRVMAEVAALAE